MSLLIDNCSTRSFDDRSELFKRILDHTLKVLDVKVSVEISILLEDNRGIRILNRDYRHKDTATDVLSFPLMDLSSMGSEKLNKELLKQIDPDTGEAALGDIVISVERAEEQAVDYGHSLEREMGFLMLHGLLHLFGYDHETSMEEAETMHR